MRLTELFLGKAMFYIYMLNNVGDRMPPWRAPALMFVCFDVWLLYFVYCWRPSR